MRLAAIIHDVYDDPNGTVLVRDAVRTNLHEKVAGLQLLPPDQLHQLPDRVFALVGTSNGVPLRKYAMHDEAHLRASILYFEQAGASALPVPAAVKVAQNLLIGCDWYDVQPSEDLQKLAGLGSKVTNGVTAALGALDVGQQAVAIPGIVRDHKSMVQQAQLSGSKRASVEVQYSDAELAKLMGMDAPNLSENMILEQALPLHTRGRKKEADIPDHAMTRTGTLPGVRPRTLATTERTSDKVSAVGELGSLGASSPPSETKVAAHLSVGAYPLDTEEQVKAAARWLTEYNSALDIHDRRAMAQSINIAADELGCKIASEEVRQYAGDTFGDVLAAELAARVYAFDGTPGGEAYAKLAASTLSPSDLVKELYTLDTQFGVDLVWNRKHAGFRDPYRAVYEKEAEESPQYTWSSGTDYTSGMLLQQLAHEYGKLESVIDADIAKAFKKDPIGIFKSLPDPEKKVLARLSGQQHNGMI